MEELECAFGVVGKILMSRILWNLFGKIWIQNVWEILDFKVISAIENSNKLQKTRFWKEKSVEDMVTLWPMAHATLILALLWTPSYKIENKCIPLRNTFFCLYS